MSLSVRLRALAISSKLAPLRILASASSASASIGENDLLQLALFRGAEARLLHLVVKRARLLVGDLARLGERGGADGEHIDGAIFGRRVGRLAIVEKALQRLGGRRGDLPGRRGRQNDVIDVAALRVKMGERLDQRFRRRQAVGQRRGDLLAQVGLALLGDEAALAQSHIAQSRIETLAAERAGRILQVRVVAQGLGDRLVRDRQAERPGLDVERGVGDQPPERLRVEADRMRLRVGQRNLHLALIALHHRLIGGAELVRRDRRAADVGDLGRPKPRKMSPMPQIAKLTMISPSTTVMIALPTNPCEAARIHSSIALLSFGFRPLRAAPPYLAASRAFA